MILGAGAPPTRPDPFAQGNNDFAVAMYGALRRPGVNLFFSPLSVRTTLAMAQAGAAGETAAQMAAVLRLPAAGESGHAGFAEALGRIGVARSGCETALANSLWCQEGAPLRQAYLDLVAAHYGGAANQVDFFGGERARAAINAWVEDCTRQKIRDLIPPGVLGALTRLVIANAAAFSGTWADPFDSSGTGDAPFQLEAGGTADVPFMNRSGRLRHGAGPGYRAVDLPYRGDDISMLVLLPDPGRTLQDLEGGLSTRLLDECVTGMRSGLVWLTLPRFTFDWGANLAGALGRVGMGLAFDALRADFSGMNGLSAPDPRALFFSHCFHSAHVEVTEEGTEAAAATAAVGMILGLPSAVFQADRPFLFAIRDRRSGALLFLGRVADPSRER
jgi:serpin B